MPEPERDEFNVVVFYRDDYSRYILRGVDGRTAVETAKKLTDAIEAESPYARGINRVIITDGGDHTNFLWERGKGIVYPTREKLAEARR